MLKSRKQSLLVCAFLCCSVAAGTATASEVFSAKMSGDGMILMSKLPIFNPDVPGQVIGFSDYQSSIPTGGSGKLDLKFTRAGGLKYKVTVAQKNLWLNSDGTPGTVGVIHIHLGKKGSYGPVMFQLFSITNDGVFPANGEFSGMLMADDLFTRPFTYGPIRPASLAEYGIRTMEDAINAIRSGNAHVNVHTAKHWPGEIAGNIEMVKHKHRPHHKH